jgi:hypothetical protein
MAVYLLKGPFMGKGNRKYVICEVDGERKKINYSRYVLLKSGIDVKKYEQVHHNDENKHNDSLKNLKPMREYIHKMQHKGSKKK